MKANLSLGKYLVNVTATTVFAYLLLDSLLVLRFGGFASRIDLLNFLIPHASKIALWSFFALVYLRPNFGWRFPFAMFMLYCSAEMLTNITYVIVHFQSLAYVFVYNVPYIIFALAMVFFSFGISLGYLVLHGRFRLRLDWSMMPFIIFVASWIAMGYQTESTIMNPTYWLEAQEFIWNVLFIIMAANVFKPKNQ